MKKLLEKIKNISIKDAIKIEESDSQYISLKNLYFKIKNKDFYLALIVANSIICYQLSSTGEKYWEEFNNYFSENPINNKDEIIEKLAYFISNSKGNKRFVETKVKRLQKLKQFLDKFIGNEKYYYENMEIFQTELANIMNQKVTDKTIVFAVKMFNYGARNYFNTLVEFPSSISIPVDSRLTNLFEIYNDDKNLKIDDFYNILSKKTNIPPLHLDAVLWVNYSELIK